MRKHNEVFRTAEWVWNGNFLSFSPELPVALADSPHANDIRNRRDQSPVLWERQAGIPRGGGASVKGNRATYILDYFFFSTYL